MGIINKLFGGSSGPKEEKFLPWITLSELSQLDTINEKSSTKTQVIFKHSTRCGISRMVMNQFVDAYLPIIIIILPFIFIHLET